MKYYIFKWKNKIFYYKNKSQIWKNKLINKKIILILNIYIRNLFKKLKLIDLKKLVFIIIFKILNKTKKLLLIVNYIKILKILFDV